MPTQPKQLFVINNTQGTVTFFIPPGAVNGPGATKRNTDLRLYGLSHTMWGEGVDENFYRLTENFACPEKATAPGNPKDENDLGLGNGINNPLNGQIWFNTTQKKLFVFDALLPGWKGIGGTIVSATAPLNPQIGDLWFDTTIPQLKVFNGTSFISVADRYVLKSGDTMTGFLTLSGNPINPLHAATKQYVDGVAQPTDGDLTAIAALTGTGIAVRSAPDAWALRTITTDATLFITNQGGVAGNPLLGIATITQMAGGSFSKFFVNSVGQVTHNTPVGIGDISAIVDSRYVNITGDTMTGALILHASPTAISPPLQAATKAYVDAAVPAIIGCLCGTFNNVTGSRALNTTFTNSFGKDMLVIVSAFSGGGDTRGFVNGIEVVINAGSLNSAVVVFVVDAGASYSVNTSGLSSLIHWYEYR